MNLISIATSFGGGVVQTNQTRGTLADEFMVLRVKHERKTNLKRMYNLFINENS